MHLRVFSLFYTLFFFFFFSSCPCWLILSYSILFNPILFNPIPFYFIVFLSTFRSLSLCSLLVLFCGILLPPFFLFCALLFCSLSSLRFLFSLHFPSPLLPFFTSKIFGVYEHNNDHYHLPHRPSSLFRIILIGINLFLCYPDEQESIAIVCLENFTVRKTIFYCILLLFYMIRYVHDIIDDLHLSLTFSPLRHSRSLIICHSHFFDFRLSFFYVIFIARPHSHLTTKRYTIHRNIT